MHVGDERYRQDHSRCEKRGEGELPTVPMRKSCDGRRARHCFTRRRATAHTARLRHTYKSSIRLVKSCSRALKQALLLPLPPPVAATQFFHLGGGGFGRKGWGLRHTITTKIVFHSGQQKNPFCPLAAFGSSATLPGAWGLWSHGTKSCLFSMTSWTLPGRGGVGRSFFGSLVLFKFNTEKSQPNFSFQVATHP